MQHKYLGFITSSPYMFLALSAPVISTINRSSRSLVQRTVIYKCFWIEIHNEEGNFHYW
jgi:hypothetical protein